VLLEPGERDGDELAAEGLACESIRKTLATLAMVLDYAGRTGEHNPARDRLTVKLPREAKAEINPPTAEHVLAVHALLPLAIACRCSSSTRRACESASSRDSRGATSTRLGHAGVSRRP
jgi:hypothetical protein